MMYVGYPPPPYAYGPPFDYGMYHAPPPPPVNYQMMMHQYQNHRSMSISSVGSSDNSHGSTKKKHQQQWNGRGGKNRRSGEEKQLALVHKVSTEKYEDDSMTLHDIKGTFTSTSPILFSILQSVYLSILASQLTIITTPLFATITGRIATVAKDQEGSRFIQKRLELADASELESAFAEVLPALRDLVNDVYGNFAVQGLLEFGTDAMKKEVGENLAVDIVSLSSKAYGYDVVHRRYLLHC